MIRVICILRPFRRLGYWKIFSKKSPTVFSLCLSPFVVVAALRLIRHVLFTLLWPRQRNVYELFLKHAYHTHEHIHICSISCANRNFVVRCGAFLRKFPTHGTLISIVVYLTSRILCLWAWHVQVIYSALNLAVDVHHKDVGYGHELRKGFKIWFYGRGKLN